MKDLVALTADQNARLVFEALLARADELGCHPFEYDVYTHPRRDPGCLLEAHDYLRPFSVQYRHALVVFDHEGCGRENEPPDALAHQVRERLARNGWASRADVVVLSPEREVWVWSPSAQVDACLGWGERQPTLRQWLEDRGMWRPGAPKPDQPKEAMEAALREVRRPRSSAVYRDLAAQVELAGHRERAFVTLRRTLRRWFPRGRRPPLGEGLARPR